LITHHDTQARRPAYQSKKAWRSLILFGQAYAEERLSVQLLDIGSMAAWSASHLRAGAASVSFRLSLRPLQISRRFSGDARERANPAIRQALPADAAGDTRFAGLASAGGRGDVPGVYLFNASNFGLSACRWLVCQRRWRESGHGT
jgi:hypothetical protein